MGIVYTIVTGVLLLSFSHQIIGIFTKDADVIYFGTLAMWYFCPFYSLLSIMHEMAGTIRGTGKTIPPMAIILFSLCIYRVLCKRNFSSPYPPRKRLVGRFWGVYSPFLNSSTNRSRKACDGRILTVICPSGTVSHHLRIVFGSSPVSL